MPNGRPTKDGLRDFVLEALIQSASCLIASHPRDALARDILSLALRAS
jgi:hypothetical protein